MSLRKSFLSLVCIAIAAPAWGQSTFDQIGLTALRDRLGANAPTGAGIEVMQPEFLDGGAYLPNSANSQFTGKTIVDRSGGGSASGHATTVGQNFYGNTSGVAPGITTINGYRIQGNLDAGDWFGPVYLNFGQGAPVVEASQRVQNHSWIGTGAFSAALQEAHRRFDFALARDNVIGVVGVNNGSNTFIPSLLGNTYNGIAVGNTNGNSSIGPSTGDVSGRSKPDIVAPSNFTSFSTPMVAGAAALLLETADGLSNPSAGRMETIKAALLTGATKEPFAAWNRFNNGNYIEPLDRRFGAGQLNVNHSHMILTAGQKNGTDQLLDGPIGWDYATLNGAGDTRTYFFNLGDATDITFTATATWLRRITPTGTGTNLFETSTATLARIELRLFEVNPDFSFGTLVDSSVSPIDNVQHLFRTDLVGNQLYGIEIRLAGLPTGQFDENVAVAWFTSFTPVPEPGTVICVSVGLAGIVFGMRRELRRRGRTSVGRTSVGRKTLAA